MKIIQGSILDFEGDAIVNPANSFLRHGGGLARVIAKAAAPLADYASMDDAYYHSNGDVSLYEQDSAWAAEQANHPNIPQGAAGVTTAGRLPFKGIIHAVGPIWGGGGYFERELLDSAHCAALTIAMTNCWEHVAFPAISCGIFGFPVEQAAPIAVEAARRWERAGVRFTDRKVSFYLFEDAHVEAYLEAAGNVG